MLLATVSLLATFEAFCYIVHSGIIGMHILSIANQPDFTQSSIAFRFTYAGWRDNLANLKSSLIIHLDKFLVTFKP